MPRRFSLLRQETALVKGPRKRMGKALLQDPGGRGSRATEGGKSEPEGSVPGTLHTVPRPCSPPSGPTGVCWGAVGSP